MSFLARTPQKGISLSKSPNRSGSTSKQQLDNQQLSSIQRNLPSTNPVRSPTPDVLQSSEKI